LPQPGSPVSTAQPRRCRSAYESRTSASEWAGESHRKRGLGAFSKAVSRNPRVGAAGQAGRGSRGAEDLAVGLHRHQVEIARESLDHAGEEHVAGTRVGGEHFLALGQAHQQLLGGVDQTLLLACDGVGHDRGVALGVAQGQLAGLEVHDTTQAARAPRLIIPTTMTLRQTRSPACRRDRRSTG
jgi:hypothetical protein